MVNDILLSTFAKGRLSVPSKIVKKLNISDGDYFIISVDGEKLIFRKINQEDLKKLSR